MGYPVVLKPAVGSWGRLLSKINDRDAAETVLETQDRTRQLSPLHLLHPEIHRQEGPRHSGIRGGGDECIAAIYRSSDHGITNTARGAIASTAR